MRRLVLGLALCCAALAGCDKAEDDENATKVGAVSLFDPAAVNPSLCAAPAVPFPNNAFFAAATASGVTADTTLSIPSSASTAVAANLTDGFSTTASAFTDIIGLIDQNSIDDGLIVLEADASPRILTLGVDYTVQPSIAMGQVSGTGGCALDPNVNTSSSRFLPIAQQRTRILIEPLKPLNPSTTYIVAVTRGLKSAAGAPVTANEFFPIVNSDQAICDRTGTNAGLVDCSDPAAPADAAARLNAPVLNVMTAPTLNPANGQPVSGATAAAIRITTLETLRANLVRPTVTGMNGLFTQMGRPTIADDDLVIAWSFTTQSISASLATLNGIATAKTFAVANTGFSTGDLGVDASDRADIWAGTLNAVPYYLDDAASANDFASQCYTGVPGVDCNAFWANNGTVTSPAAGGFVPWTPLADYDGAGPLGVTPAPCTTGVPPFNWVAPASTTNCHRIPLERSTENLLVMITVPNANSGHTKPVDGWPVVIFQHGITGNRTQALPVAGALAAQGFVVVSIDLPLHGLVPAGSTATCGATSNNAFYTAGVERTFDLDLANNVTGAFVPDGVVDCSGTHMINLTSLITSRDNLRQAVADQIHLIRSLQAANPINLDGDGATDDIDASRIHFAGISLGSMVGTTLLGVDTGASAAADGSDEAIIAASLSVPGGGVAKLLDASKTFGPRIAAGLAGVAFSTNASGTGSPFEGTDTYETFVRFAQHLVDPGDPINYAAAANANHRIHMTMVENDTVVPNSALSNCPAASALTPGIGGTPAASNAAADTRQAACLAGAALVGANATSGAPTNACPGVATTGVCTATTGQDETLISGFLSGTEPLYGEMALAVAGPITPPAQATNQGCTGLDIVVQFAIGSHGSLLDPTASGVTTVEMQRQLATYLVSDGTTLGTLCP